MSLVPARIKNPHVKQDGKRDFITALEAVSADGFLFPSYLIGKGYMHSFDWYKHVEAEDKEARWAVSPKGWTNSKIGYDWLTNIYDPISKARCLGESCRYRTVTFRISAISSSAIASRTTSLYFAFLHIQHTSCNLLMLGCFCNYSLTTERL